MERSRSSFPEKNPLFTEESRSKGRSETLQELAERVLFSPSLEEKLQSRPLDLDSAPAPCSPMRQLGRDLNPARAAEHKFSRGDKSRPSLPKRAALVNDESRGILLHFFANHELLAAELMALALLRFPDTPVEFRQGLAKALREEQRHTRWYLARMAECGIELGQYPLSPYFWDAISPMKSPLDYVSRLSLTFEQANLDYAQHFSAMLGEAGDKKSASILHRIYEDEIAHVSYGLHWFRQWKDPVLSDWEALEERLPFPLSPSRAKGNQTLFNSDGRRAAGFDEDYIRRLALFERSKGRTPNVFFFNPDAEQRAECWPRAYHPDSARRSVAGDLEILAGFLARKDDVLLLRQAPSAVHLEKLARCGLAIPEIELLTPDGCVDPQGLVASRKKNAIHPWGLSPDLEQRFAALQEDSTSIPLPSWTSDIRNLFSKAKQVQALGHWMQPSYVCHSSEDVEQATRELQEQGQGQILRKQAFSTAGSGLSVLSPDEVIAWAGKNNIPLGDADQAILIEPYHDRVFDFSVQYRVEDQQLRRIGFVEQRIQGLGAYRGSICRTKFCKSLDPELAQFLMDECLPQYEADGPLAADLLHWLRSSAYQGPLGIDAYVYRREDGTLAHRTICEVNPRYTMGWVALELKRRIAPGKSLAFSVTEASRLSPDDDAPQLDAQGRMVGGSIVLTEPSPRTRFAAIARVF